MGERYDVIVVGLGHAGCEAALACARMGLATLGVTLKVDRIALMSCNPAIGGTAKGHLVKELDALGGEMAHAADQAGTHFKTLNASKGPAVRATRVLCDRERYAEVMRTTLLGQPGLDLVEAEVERLVVEDGRVRGVLLRGLGERRAQAVILTTGTFLMARMHVGDKQEIGGRLGDGAASGLSESLREVGLELRRFKTGTPPRLLRASIDVTRLEPQPGDEPPAPFSLRTRARKDGARFPPLPQLLCHITWTRPSTHEVVRRNLGRSALHQGQIVGRGPRYCPSLEDKVVRFADRERHQVFLEPEGLGSPLVYPAGLSTSLPPEVQEEFLRTIPGLEEVRVARHGYAVEYDYAPPTQLLPTLEVRQVRGLFLAGQLNGTSGYEEAAFQGLWAGINAGLSIQGAPPLLLGRHEAHGAVLVDELVTKGVDEPFRMLTSRSEHRLELRESNAELRLRGHGHRVGLVSAEELARTEERRSRIEAEVRRLKAGPLAARLRRPEETYHSIAAHDGERPELPEEVTSEVEVMVKYEGYIEQHRRAAARESKDADHWHIPAELSFEAIHGLSKEAVDKLRSARPATVAQARAVPGVTPAAISLLLVHLRKQAMSERVR